MIIKQEAQFKIVKDMILPLAGGGGSISLLFSFFFPQMF